MKFLDAFSRTPSGFTVERSYAEAIELLAKTQLRKNASRAARRSEIATRIDLYEDRVDTYLQAQIARQFENDDLRESREAMKPEAVFQNITKRLINETSTVYSEEATRSVGAFEFDETTGEAKETAGNTKFQAYLKAVGARRRMRRLNQLVNLTNDVLVWNSVKGDGAGHNDPRFRLVTGNKWDALYDPYDPLELVGHLLDLPSDITRADADPYHVVWTEEAKFYLTKEFKLARWRWPEGTVFLDKEQLVAANPLGFIPGNIIHRRPPLEMLQDYNSGRDLTSAHMAINLLNLALLVEQRDGTTLVYVQGSGVKEIAGDQPLDRRFVISLPDEVDVGSVDLQAKPESFIATARSVLHQIAANRGVSPESFDLSGDAKSGFELQIKRSSLREIRRDQVVDYHEHEAEIWETASRVMTKEASSEYKFPFEEFLVDFGEQEVPRSPKDKWEIRKLKRTLGHSDPIAEAMQDNPELDFQRAEAEVRRHMAITVDFMREWQKAVGEFEGGAQNKPQGMDNQGRPGTNGSKPAKPAQNDPKALQ